MFQSEIARLRKMGVQGRLQPKYLDDVSTTRRTTGKLTHQLLFQALNFLNVIASGLMMWKALCLFTNSDSPIVVVLSGSMEPAFYRGDILFLWNPESEPYVAGDITVYNIPGNPTPIVHRVIETHTSNSTQLLLTKGDNNPVDDIIMYNGLKWIEREHIIGKVRGFLPYVGYVTIAMHFWTTQEGVDALSAALSAALEARDDLQVLWKLVKYGTNDFPQLKYALLGTVGVFLLLQKEHERS